MDGTCYPLPEVRYINILPLFFHIIIFYIVIFSRPFFAQNRYWIKMKKKTEIHEGTFFFTDEKNGRLNWFIRWTCSWNCKSVCTVTPKSFLITSWVFTYERAKDDLTKLFNTLIKLKQCVYLITLNWNVTSGSKSPNMLYQM